MHDVAGALSPREIFLRLQCSPETIWRDPGGGSGSSRHGDVDKREPTGADDSPRPRGLALLVGIRNDRRLPRAWTPVVSAQSLWIGSRNFRNRRRGRPIGGEYADRER